MKVNLFKSISRIAFLLVSGGMILSSCGNKKDINAETAARHIMTKSSPEMLLSLSAKDLLDKSGMSTGEVMPMSFKMLFSEMTDYVTDEKKTGISFEGKSFIAIDLSDEGEFDNAFAIFNLKDPETFQKMLKEDLEAETEEKNGYSYVISPDDAMAIGWYKTFGVAVVTDRNSNKEAIAGKLDELMVNSISDEGSLSEGYEKLIATNKDIAFMYQLKSMMTVAEKESHDDQKEMIAKMKEMYGDSYSIYSLQFDVDKITAEIDNYLNEEAKNKFGKMFAKGISPDFLKYITNDKAIGFFTVAMSPEPAVSFYKDLSAEAYQSMQDEISRETGIKIEDLTASFTGEMTMAMLDIQRVEKTYTYTNMDGEEESYSYTGEEPVFTLSIGIKGDLIRNIVDTTKAFTKKENYYVVDNYNFFAFANNKLFVSNNEELTKEVAANGSLKMFEKSGVTDQATSNATFGYFDFNALSAIIPDKEKQARDIVGNFDYAIATGNAEKVKAELHMKKSGKNALYTITASIMNSMFSMGI